MKPLFRFTALSLASVWSSVAFGQIGLNPPINLEWRESPQTVIAGDTFQIGLYAVATGPDFASVSNIEAALVWDPGHLRLLERINNGPYRWFSSGFTTLFGFDPEGLNDTWTDGNAQYLASRQLTPLPPFYASPNGTLVTTFVFEALAETPATFISTPANLGANRTRVFDGLTPGLDVTGNLGTAQIRIVPEPNTFALLLLTAIPFGGIMGRRHRR